MHHYARQCMLMATAFTNCGCTVVCNTLVLRMMAYMQSSIGASSHKAIDLVHVVGQVTAISQATSGCPTPNCVLCSHILV